MSWELIVKQKFSAAHFLRHYSGKCEKMHGHTFELQVQIGASELDRSGVSIDFTILKDYLRQIVPDHQVLNDIFDFSPSAENLARYFFEQIKAKYPVRRVIVWESENAGAVYAEDQ